MHIGHRFGVIQTLRWSRHYITVPAIWASVVTGLYVLAEVNLSIPWLPMSLVGIAVAFYLGFKNNASYDRLWEARKIWGAIVNASRSWAYSCRDLITRSHLGPDDDEVDDVELAAIHTRLVERHVAWMDALRHQLRKIKSWEHAGPHYDAIRKATNVPELSEDLEAILRPNLSDAEHAHVLAQINPAAHLLACQSRDLADLRDRGLLDGFAHMELQAMLTELMTQQGKAERIKNFPFPRQYATVNSFFAFTFAALAPFALLGEFAELAATARYEHLVWLTVPFTSLVCWVFLTTDKIGDWSENPFEGLANDVPITAMSRGIERDIRQMIGQTELPPPREPDGSILF